MSLTKPIGGYFELELSRGDFPHSDGILLSSGRGCFEYVLRALKPTRVYMPKYICDVMLEPLKKLAVDYAYYSISDNLEIVGLPDLQEGEVLLYVNYFGLKDDYCSGLAERYKEKLILDYSQAFFSAPPPETHTLYSPRKFFGLPDGGILVTSLKLEAEMAQDESYRRFNHLLKRVDLGPQAGYEDFKAEDASLSNQPLKTMSALTKRLLGSINYEHVRQQRLANFAKLDEILGSTNKFKMSVGACPMVYPFLSERADLRQKLIDSQIFVATYWPNVLSDADEQSLEYRLAEKLLPLPIDQRYQAEDMMRITEVING